ncbi:MAG TPA: DMT family transporter [Casimicrobiaceae bacterium]
MPTTDEAHRLHRRAILFMIVAPLCWSSGGLLVRLLSVRDAWEIVFWRSVFMAIFVAGTLLVMHGRRMPQAVRDVGWPGLLSAAFLAGQFFLFIASLTRTTVANTFVLMSVSPFLAALAARVFLREPVPLRTWLAMTVAFAGMVVMFSDSIDAGRLAGNLLAVGVSVLFALNVTVLRKVHAHVDMLPTVMIAGLLSIVVALPLALPFEVTNVDLGVLAVLGFVQLGAGCLLMVAASRHLSATELGLLALLEPILGPVWVWALLGEHPGRLALVGGAVVLAAVVVNEAWAFWRSRPQRADRSPPAAIPGP